jgi:ABC-type dipeptide/oligopeptide/nickel transport system ATPase component
MGVLKGLYHHLVYRLKGIQVIALVGKSGTGKSFRAQLIARTHGADLIVDDGLLIRDQRIIAGQSAKQAPGAYTAIKTALFGDPQLAAEVRRQLAHERFKRILVLGTSVRMVETIARRLDLPAPGRIITIEEVSTSDEIARARRARNEGKHIIPVPAVEVRRSHSQIFFNAIRIFFKRKVPLMRKADVFEKSIVRPLYSRQGRLAISEQALGQMVHHCVDEAAPSVRVTRVTLLHGAPVYSIDVHLDVPYGEQIPALTARLQTEIVESIESLTGIVMEKVNVIVDTVAAPGQG